MLKKLTAIATCAGILSTSVMAQGVDYNLFPTSNSKIYVAQGLLHSDENWDTAYELLREIVKNDKAINPVSMKKVQKAIKLIKSYRLSKIYSEITGSGQFKSRPYVEAQLYLAEALMDSRVFLNQSYDSEVELVEKLLKNYFFPMQGDRVTIHYPNPQTYAFNKWGYSKQAVEDAQTGVAVEGGVFDFLGDAVQSGNNGQPNRSNYSNNNANTTRNNNSGNQNNKSANLVNNDPNGKNKGLIEDAVVIVDTAAEVADKASDLIDKYKKYEEKRERIQNRYLPQSMLLQAIAEPGSVIVDPQLQEFIKGVRIEYQLGSVDKPMAYELDALNQGLEDDVVTGDDRNITINLSKLFNANRDGVVSNVELQFRDVPGDASKAALYLISSVSGEDLMFNRVLQQSVALAQNMDTIMASQAAQATVGTITTTIPGFLVHLGDVLRKTIKTGSAANELGTIGSIWNSSKKVVALGLSKAEAPVKVMENIANSQGLQKLLDNTVRTEFVQSGKLFDCLVALGVIMETTVAVIEYNAATTEDARIDAALEGLSRVGAQLVYLVPYVGVAAMGVDFLHYTMGLPIETADLFRGAAYLGETVALWQMGYNRTTFMFHEFEEQLNVPRTEYYFFRHILGVRSITEVMDHKQAVFNEVQDTALKNLMVIYRAHREAGDKSNYDFGKKLAEYNYAFDNVSLKAAEDAINSLNKEIPELRAKEQVADVLDQTLEVAI